jgi:hypothetical protein
MLQHKISQKHPSISFEVVQCVQSPGKPGGTEIKWDTSPAVYADDVNLLGDNIHTMKKSIETLTNISKKVGLELTNCSEKQVYVAVCSPECRAKS